jgi:NADH-quinone oxidoreductase subunit L
MAAGCVIHLAGDENDLMRMGGLAKHGPRGLCAVFVAGALCLAGAPLTGGFFSKDGILLAAYTQGSGLFLALWGIALLTALLTAAYTFRLVYLVFAGESRGHAHPHPLPLLMRWPLWPLALLGLGGGLLNLPPLVGGGTWLNHRLGSLAGRTIVAPHATEWALAGLATGLVILGWGLARWRYGRFREEREQPLGRFLLRGWGADALVDAVVVRPFAAIARFCAIGCDRALVDATLDGIARQTTACGERLRGLTTGRVSTYLGAFAWGFLIILGWFLLVLVR